VNKTFKLEKGLTLTEDELLALIFSQVNPSDEHYQTFLKTFDAMVEVLRAVDTVRQAAG
jgi:hypothetical protein